MFIRRLKLNHTRCFLPAFLFNRNELDEEGTEVLPKKKVSGWQGVVNAFSFDEEGNPSPEIRALTSTITFSGLFGGLYGSLSYSKNAYLDFFEKNQSTLFQNQFEAKAKLQAKVTLAMGKGMFKWGTRVALFCGPFTTITTIINAYQGDVSVISYSTAGFFVGGCARLSLGLRGFAVGSVLGAILGTIVGFLTLLILKFSPVTMEEMIEYKSQAEKERDLYFIREQKQSAVFKYDQPPELLEHDKRIEVSETVENNTA